MMQAQSPQKVPTPQSEAPTATLADKPAAPTPAEEIPAAPPGPLETDVLSLGEPGHLSCQGLHARSIWQALIWSGACARALSR